VGWKSPCHMCQIANIESELRVGRENEITYQQIIDTLYLEESEFYAYSPVTFRQSINLVSELANRITKLLNLSGTEVTSKDEVLRGTTMDLRTMQRYSDVTVHWELCDCYE
jgi:McbB family protein